MNKVIETIIKIILVALLFVCIFTFGILNMLSKTIFSQEYTLEMLDKSNYYANIYSQIKSDFRNYIYQSGLDENVIEDIVTPEEVKNETRKIIVGIYNGLHEDVDTTKIHDRLNDNINKSLEGKKIDSQTQEAINTFVNQIVDQYQETITKTEYENPIYKNFSKIQKIVNKGKKITILLAVTLGALIIITYYKKIFKNINIEIVKIEKRKVIYHLHYFSNYDLTIENYYYEMIGNIFRQKYPNSSEVAITESISKGYIYTEYIVTW